MNFFRSLFRNIRPFLLFCGLISAVLFWHYAPRAKSAQILKNPAEIMNYDIRAEKPEAIENDKNSRFPEVIAPDFSRGENFLTAPSNQKRADILRNYLRQHSDLFGLDDLQVDKLNLAADYTNPAGNLSFVHFEQQINGIPVFQGEVKAGFTKRGEIVRIINNLAPNLDYESLSNEFGNAESAVSNAAKFIDSAPINASPTTEKFYFPMAPGIVRTAQRVFLQTNSNAFYVIVDAQDGTLLWRKNLTENQTQPATYNVYGNLTSLMKTADSPTAFTPGCLTPLNCPQPPIINRQSFTLIGNEPPYNFNNNGWINDGENRTVGNAAEAGIDRDGTQGIDPNGWAFGNPNRNFVYSYNPAPGNPAPGEEPLPTTQTYPPSAFQQGSITNAFYTVNRYHDELYRLGFTEAARNFQTDNYGRGGTGNDSLSVEVQDSSGTSSANFSTPADGGRGRLQLFVWTSPTPDRDGALDNQTIVHELTHGTSNRLHGNASGLSGNMARGMGEGWSDFYALALLSEPSDDSSGTYSIGSYSSYEIISGYANYYYGIRRFPLAIKAAVGSNGLPHNPLTFKYLNANCNTLIGTATTNPNSAFPRGQISSTTCDQVHNAGEIWSVALWEVRNQLIARRGAAEGNRRALQSVTDGMKLAPLNPTMLQERDAILAAAQGSDAGDVCPVWRGFAIRGMGVSASIQNIGSGANNTAVTEAFDIPVQCRRTTRADFDGDGKSDVSVFRPSEGIWYMNRSTAGFGAVRWGLSTDKIVPGDYDGDGKTDFAIFRAESDANLPDFYVLNSANFTVSGYSWGIPGDVPIVEDYDGDNKDDVAIYRASTGYAYVLKSSGGVFIHGAFLAGAPTVGDFDGDGKADFASHGLTTWFVFLSTTNYGYSYYEFGDVDEKPVQGDYDGDGIDDLALFRPSTGIWTIRNSSGGTTIVNFGLPTDVPVPADYDGDGRTDVAIFRPSNGQWWLNRSTVGIAVTQFGLSNDIPIISGYLP